MEPVAVQPPGTDTVARRTSGPACPAEKTMLRLPCPDVRTPFAIVQAYVAPGPASGTDATIPVVPGATGLGTSIAADVAGPGGTVTVAEPMPTFVHFASETEVTVYVVVEPGETTRRDGLTVSPFSTKPSDHVTFQGPVPVRSARSSADCPAQIVVEPLTVAVGGVITVTVVLPEPTPEQ
jgi:hypothetical protein